MHTFHVLEVQIHVNFLENYSIKKTINLQFDWLNDDQQSYVFVSASVTFIRTTTQLLFSILNVRKTTRRHLRG